MVELSWYKGHPMTPKNEAGKRGFYLELPEGLARRLDELLEHTGRPVEAETILALEHWLERQGVGESAIDQPPPPATPSIPPAEELQEQRETGSASPPDQLKPP